MGTLVDAAPAAHRRHRGARARHPADGAGIAGRQSRIVARHPLLAGVHRHRVRGQDRSRPLAAHRPPCGTGRHAVSRARTGRRGDRGADGKDAERRRERGDLPRGHVDRWPRAAAISRPAVPGGPGGCRSGAGRGDPVSASGRRASDRAVHWRRQFRAAPVAAAGGTTDRGRTGVLPAAAGRGLRPPDTGRAITRADCPGIGGRVSAAGERHRCVIGASSGGHAGR